MMLFGPLVVWLLVTIFGPYDVTQGVSSKLLYIHVPTVWIAYLAYTLTFLYSALYLFSKKSKFIQAFSDFKGTRPPIIHTDSSAQAADSSKKIFLQDFNNTEDDLCTFLRDDVLTHVVEIVTDEYLGKNRTPEILRKNLVKVSKITSNIFNVIEHLRGENINSPPKLKKHKGKKRFEQFIYGFYPLAERWRIDASFCLLFVAAAPLLYPDIKFRKYMLIFSCLYPFIAFILIKGGLFNLLMIETNLFGGAMLTLIIGVTSIACSLPLGILLALGRQSRLKLVKVISVCFIEFMRGVPLITLLFVASTMLNYFLPPGTNFNLLIRVIIMMTFFSAAYIAEVIRGGIQAIPKGQYEAADAIGLTYWQTTRFITLPQALKISIPGIVNTFIGLYKDTTLVVIIGLLDPLGIGRAALADTKWNGLSTETYLFVAVIFFVSCFAMSRYSLWLEKKLSTEHN